ncbi:hypothetical protein GIB67_026754 [Kingdonia uniflora]|uniref:KIB1-4 beta-propeller domain-containing protein n=1 Tax=Kingdonia uniflora TaxID=39325 RepID=A0A7J7MHT4_9MAGN|nr:hypothetical protein GIB67_026754 [Kingdonia uniflora]
MISSPKSSYFSQAKVTVTSERDVAVQTNSSCFYSLDSKNHYRREREVTVTSVFGYYYYQNYRGHGLGWMATVGYSHNGISRFLTVSLVNPITGDEILLPLLNGLNITYATLSSNPTLTSDSENHCLVMALLTVDFSSESIVFCKPGDDNWTVIENVKGHRNDLAYCNGVLYCLNSIKSVFVCDIGTSSVGPATNMYNMMRIDPDSFRSLVAHFRDTGLFKDSMHIDVEEKLAIFMHIIAHKMSNRATNSRYWGGDNNEDVDEELFPNVILFGAAEREASIILRDMIAPELALAHNAQNVNNVPN